MKQIEIEIDGRMVKGYAIFKNGVLWTHAEGETWTTVTSKRRRGSKGGAATAGAGAHVGAGNITAPMPGKIIKINSVVGAQIKTGDVIIVMEAMKMEYTLKARTPGRLIEIRCAAGDQVPLGTVLAKMEVEETS